MKRLLLGCALIASAVCVSLIADEHYDRHGRRYYRDRGVVGGTWHGLFGGHRHYDGPSEGYCEEHPNSPDCR